MEDFKDLQKFHRDCGRRVLLPNVPMEVSKSIWRLLSFCFRNVRKGSVKKIWEHNPCAWGEVLRSPKSICHWKQQGPSWLLWHPFRSHSSTEWFSWPGVLFLCPDDSLTLVGLRYRLYEQQTPQNSNALSKKQKPTNHQDKVHRPKKHCKRKRKHGEMRKSAEHRTDVKLRWEMCCYLWQSSKTEFQNATEAARGSNYMFVFFPLFPFRQITLPLSSSLEPKGRAGSCSVIQTMQTVCRI